ncbi:MAG: hypothetical protein EX260_05005 [Desulfobulbaceae bacterium]|nr:MAG: hypothetical protein EX260_05005 [Desulfobulbaceae bacterium]
MEFRTSVIIGLLLVGLTMGTGLPVRGATCTGATYKSSAFDQEVTEFSPFDTIYLILDCTGLSSGEHTMHANWLHNQRGMIRSDSHTFTTEDGNKKGLYFWFKLSKKGPVASMLSNQDFHEQNFGDWTAEIYLDDARVIERGFNISD